MSHAPLHSSYEGGQGAGHKLCYHFTLSGLSCMNMQSHSITGVLSQNSPVLKPVVGYKWKIGVRPCRGVDKFVIVGGLGCC